MHTHLNRATDAEAHFTDWYFGEGTELLLPFIKHTLNDAMSTVFSKDGSRVNFEVDASDVFPGDLRLKCDIQIDEFEAYASAELSLRALLTEAVECAESDEYNQKIADALRELADEIDPPAA